MSADKRKGKIIAQVASANGPPRQCTLAEWFEWRRAEDERMYADLKAQLVAHFEREAGVIEH